MRFLLSRKTSPWISILLRDYKMAGNQLISVNFSPVAVQKDTNSAGKNELFQTEQDTKGVGFLPP